MTALAQAISRTTGTRIDVESLNAGVVFGSIMLLVSVIAISTYGIDRSFAFF